MAFWIQLRRAPPFWFQFLTVPTRGGLDLGLMNGRPILLNLSAAGWRATAKPAATDWETGQWHHVTVTWNGEQHTLYLDGAPLENLSLAGVAAKPAAPGPAWIHLGSAPRENDKTSDMVIDELTIFDRCLAPQEVAALTRAPATKPR
jgi:hypothetical protein